MPFLLRIKFFEDLWRLGLARVMAECLLSMQGALGSPALLRGKKGGGLVPHTSRIRRLRLSATEQN